MDPVLHPKTLGCSTKRAEQELVLWACCLCQAALPSCPGQEPLCCLLQWEQPAGRRELGSEYMGLCGAALATWQGLARESFCPLFC